MQKYKTIKKLGSGAFGHVEKAQNIQTKEIVAIKKLKKKYSTWDQCLQLAEVKALRKLIHPNIIKLKQVVRVTNEAYFVFEYIDRDLYKLCQERKEKGKQLTQNQIKNISYQVAQALLFMHKQGFFHRDLKPQNLLVSQQNTVKLIDLGLAKQIRSKPPFTQYVSTRWYRAPQIILKSSSYSAPVDVFAFGCVLAQMYLMKPLFMGTSQIDQLNKICSLLGTPTQQQWSEGHKLANLKGYNFPQYTAIPLNSIFPNCSSQGLNLIAQCLRFDPNKRITMNQIINHPYFKDVKIEIKIKQQQNPFEQIGTKFQNKAEYCQTPKYQHNISQDQFDQILNGFSSSKKQKKQQINSQTKVQSQKKSDEPLQTFTYSLAKKLEPEMQKDSRYGGYMPSFNTTGTNDKNKKTFGRFGLQSIKR